MKSPGAQAVIRVAQKTANKKKALIFQRFFKTGPGQYGEGDIFWGLTVPQSRLIAKQFTDLPLTEISKLLKSPVHEIRLIGLLILVDQYEKNKNRKSIIAFYLKNLKYVNNWDLVDLTAHKILGDWLLNKPTSLLDKLANSKNLWERRVAVIASFPHIKNNNFKPTIKLAKKLLKDEHDLMHKAVGWMLREMGKKSLFHLRKFLNDHVTVMPRTMLRYAIERLPEKERQKYLKIKL